MDCDLKLNISLHYHIIPPLQNSEVSTTPRHNVCSVFLYVSYTGSQLVDLDSEKCVCVCVCVCTHTHTLTYENKEHVLCSHNMSVTLALC